jgi:RHS repeat-associated protein
VFTRWVWDGNTPLHEQRSYYTLDWDEVKKENYDRETKYPLITWVFEEGTFVPAAKITEKEQLSVATNYLGTPEAMYREDGEAVWTCELNSYGKVRNWQGGSKTDCPFRYQGQYEDAETGLYYNRFRYYSPEEGMYLSQDPIGLYGGADLYAYVHNLNSWIDPFGLVKYIVYQAKEIDTGKIYTGRTSGSDDMTVDQILNKRHANHHRNLEPLQSVYETDNYKAVRGGEQYYIEQARKAGVAADQINGISLKKANKKGYEVAFADPANDKTGKLDDGCP